MMPEPETHHHHHHVTGLKWFDLVLPISALFVSIVSLALAVIHGQAMERMADANARLVQANSWPFLQFGNSNLTAAGEPELQLVILNNGVGPAKIETFELFWKGQPVRNAKDLLETCCGLRPGELPDSSVGADRLTSAERVARARQALRTDVVESTVHGRVLEPREAITFLRLPLTPADERVYRVLDENSSSVTVRACYCSVFDECWLSNLQTMKPSKVAECPKPKVSYH